MTQHVTKGKKYFVLQGLNKKVDVCFDSLKPAVLRVFSFTLTSSANLDIQDFGEISKLIINEVKNMGKTLTFASCKSLQILSIQAD